LSEEQKPKVNGFMLVNFLQYAGLGRHNKEKILFARQECINLWTKLDEIDSDPHPTPSLGRRQSIPYSGEIDRGIIVQGPPGVGKSC
jgi:hypothetical protein